VKGRFPQLGEATLTRAILRRAEQAPHAVASVIVRSDGSEESYSIAELLARAGRYASTLLEHARPGEPARVCVCLYHGIDLHAAFLGAMLAGEIPSMIAPPSPRMERRKYADSFARMLEHIRPEHVVTEPVVIEELAKLELAQPSSAHILPALGSREEPPIAISDVGQVPIADGKETDIALIQHSSGTTGLQKGIALSHGAVLRQIRSYAEAIALDPADRIATWLPLYHDMGLMACFILPLVTGLPIVELSPFDWVESPALLLQKITQHRATLCWLPNFAYPFLAKSVRPHQLEGLDLSSIRAFVNCSEPVLPESHRKFCERFAAYGVRAEQLTACYAMAENVFAVTQTPLGEAPFTDRVSRSAIEHEHRAVPAAEGEPALELASNGHPLHGVEVQVVDPGGSVCSERQVGEICVRGISLFSGYYGRGDLTEAAFLGDWYRTGDLGYLAEGRLYVTGRLKDLVIIQGRNLYPSDIEAVVSAIPGVLDGRVVAFGERDAATATETLVVLAECAHTDAAEQGRLKLEIRRCVAQHLDCTAGKVHLVPPRWLIKSTAGKIARHDNRLKYEAHLKT
jgi:acyl-CoA synthetase (AMP-forming)/AMP-acid ligase II